jgi:hypothetical protein
VELWANGELEAVFPNGIKELQGHYKATLGYQFLRDIAAYLSTRTMNPVYTKVMLNAVCLA